MTAQTYLIPRGRQPQRGDDALDRGHFVVNENGAQVAAEIEAAFAGDRQAINAAA